MDELKEKLKLKLDEMQKAGLTSIKIDFEDIAKMYKIICFMKQVKEIVNCGEQ